MVYSHAHEEDVPGTVNLKAIGKLRFHLLCHSFLLDTNFIKEGDDTFMGQALFPVPSQDPNDPLQVPENTLS